MEFFADGMKRARGLGRRLGPYLLVAALVPGGILLALVHYLYRNRRNAIPDTDSSAPVGLPGD